MALLAVVDISNTRVTVGLFEGERLRLSYALAAEIHRTADEYAVLVGGFLREEGIARDRVTGAVIGSVVPPLTSVFEQVCERLFRTQPLVLGAPNTRTGIKVATQHPREVGPDRVANAIAAFHLYGAPAIVVDFDTATSFDVVGPDGAYVGSAIAPGLALSAEALFLRTSRLQRVELARPRSAIGKDTVGALQSGLVFGHTAMVEGMIVRLRAELGNPDHCTVIATGEHLELVTAETPAFDRIEPALTLTGLRLFHELNTESRRPNADLPLTGGNGHS